MQTKYWKCLNLGTILITMIVLGSYSGAQSPTNTPTIKDAITSKEDLAIRKTIAGIGEAWNNHDMKAYGALLTEDVHWVNVVGMHWRGHKAVMDAHIAFHKTSFKNHKIKTDSVEIRFLGSDVAIAVVTTTNDEFTTPDGSTVPKRQNRQTYVLRRSSESWMIAHCHNVPVDPQAAKFDPVNTAR